MPQARTRTDDRRRGGPYEGYETPEQLAGANLRQSVDRVGSAAAGAGRRIGGVLGSALSLTPTERERAGYLPEIDEPIGDYARRAGMIERHPGAAALALPEIGSVPAGEAAGPPTSAIRTAATGGGMTRGGRGWRAIEALGDEDARAGVRARATRMPEIGAIDPLTLSAADIESDMGSRALLDARHAQRLDSIDIGDPYLRARAAEAEAAKQNAGLEGLALVPTDEAPNTSVYQEGGVYKNRRDPRFTGQEYKTALARQLEAELQIGRAGAAEREKAHTEEQRRKAYLSTVQQQIVGQARAQEAELRAMGLQGDQLAVRMQQLKKETAEKLHQAMVESFAIGARFNVKTDDSYR